MSPARTPACCRLVDFARRHPSEPQWGFRYPPAGTSLLLNRLRPLGHPTRSPSRVIGVTGDWSRSACSGHTSPPRSSVPKSSFHRRVERRKRYMSPSNVAPGLNCHSAAAPLGRSPETSRSDRIEHLSCQKTARERRSLTASPVASTRSARSSTQYPDELLSIARRS